MYLFTYQPFNETGGFEMNEKGEKLGEFYCQPANPVLGEPGVRLNEAQHYTA